MKETGYYEVAGHRFCVSGEAKVFALMENYAPFRQNTMNNAEYMVFALSVELGNVPEYTEELRQEDEGQEIICGHSASGEAVFEFRWWGVTEGCLVCSADYHEGRLISEGRYNKMAIDNTLMVLFALSTADMGTVLFHAAVVNCEGKGYMFLGPSGTGKSTHASLWQRYLSGVTLVNDDNPVLRLYDNGHAVVYGSPWSGKTPCYRNVSYPLGAIVMLSQAPYNKIQRMNGICAYVILKESVSGKSWDERIADGLHQTVNTLASTIPIWHLECLPDEEAARLCFENVTPNSSSS